MVVNARPLKRMKSRVTADLYDFHSFPPPSHFPGAFRMKVRDFLGKHAMLPPPSSLFPHLMTWQIQFRVGDDIRPTAESLAPAVVCLDVIEEDVARSRSIYCDQCRVVGWSGHPVCGKRYHFIIKSDGNSIGGYQKPCVCCGDVIHLSEAKCKSCNLEANADDVEDWVYSQLENTTHLLHGVIHSNGYGHLLRVNGREGGSRILSGRHIMDFWDRLCKVLGARKISVMDVSKKYGLEYRLLHSITKGHPWYGDWGYKFGAGSFAHTLGAYAAAVEALSNLPLSVFGPREHKPRTLLSDIISHYKSRSELELESVRDLFRFVLDLLRDAREKTPSAAGDPIGKIPVITNLGTLWSRRDVERVTESMLRVLRAVSESNWVSRRSLKGAVFKGVVSELLDYCLQELGGKIAPNGAVVNARLNPDTKALEYRLEARDPTSKQIPASNEAYVSTSQSVESLTQDLRYLYECILHPRTAVDYPPHATRQLAISSAERLLDCKQFVKEFDSPETLNHTNHTAWLILSCEAELVDEAEEPTSAAKPPPPPPELVVLPPDATAFDLKLEATRAFQDVYVMFRRFQAEEVVVVDNHRRHHESGGGLGQSTRVKSLLSSGGTVRVRGRCHVKHGMSRFRMERGVERWTVDCSCGARDDDGERMSACDVCSVWQHTRCSGIPDSDSVPVRFVCHRCRTGPPPLPPPCKDEVLTGGGGGFAKVGLTAAGADVAM